MVFFSVTSFNYLRDLQMLEASICAERACKEGSHVHGFSLSRVVQITLMSEAGTITQKVFCSLSAVVSAQIGRKNLKLALKEEYWLQSHQPKQEIQRIGQKSFDDGSVLYENSPLQDIFTRSSSHLCAFFAIELWEEGTQKSGDLASELFSTHACGAKAYDVWLLFVIGILVNTLSLAIASSVVLNTCFVQPINEFLPPAWSIIWFTCPFCWIDLTECCGPHSCFRYPQYAHAWQQREYGCATITQVVSKAECTLH